MRKQPIPSVTNLPPAPAEERRSRIVRYTIAMTIRVLCIIGAVLTSSILWLFIIFAVGAVLLPYFAVINANASAVTPPANQVPPPQKALPASSNKH